MGSVSIQEVYKAYGRVEVIKGVSLNIAEGEFVTLVGPSGCGKSTLLRMIAGLEDISAGEIYINNRLVNNLPPKSRDIAMVFQNYALYPHMTVAANMGFAMRLQKQSKGHIKQAVDEAAEVLGLSQLLDRYPKQLSGGQRQRVAMGRAIVRHPQVFLFDEPLSNLDAKLRVQMRSEIKQLHQRLKTTTVYVTHDQIEAMTLADRIVVMNKGIVEQIGEPMELYDRPANLFVANFIGSPSMNIIKGSLSNKNGAFLTTNDGGSLPLSRLPTNRAGSEVLLGIRPEHLRIDNTGVGCEIKIVEKTGSDTIAVVAIGEETITALFRERIDIQAGQKIGLAAIPQTEHFFNPSDGTRIPVA